MTKDKRPSANRDLYTYVSALRLRTSKLPAQFGREVLRRARSRTSSNSRRSAPPLAKSERTTPMTRTRAFSRLSENLAAARERDWRRQRTQRRGRHHTPRRPGKFGRIGAVSRV